MRNTKRRRITGEQLDRQIALASRKIRLLEAKVIREGIANHEELDRMAEQIEQPPLGVGSLIEWGDGIHRIESANDEAVIVTEVSKAATTAP